jgi:ribonucleotide reductase alpha subunit
MKSLKEKVTELEELLKEILIITHKQSNLTNIDKELRLRKDSLESQIRILYREITHRVTAKNFPSKEISNNFLEKLIKLDLPISNWLYYLTNN